MAVAETGSGKGLAFGLPALSKFATDDAKTPRKNRQPAMLVLAPTRELACQSYEVLDEFCKIVGARCAVAYGGAPRHEQQKTLKNCAAARRDARAPQGLHRRRQRGPVHKSNFAALLRPRRNPAIDSLVDLRTGVDLSKVRFLCFDEADRMLDMGFIDAVRSISICVLSAQQARVHVFGDVAPGRAQSRRRLPQRGPRQSRRRRQAPRVLGPRGEPPGGPDGRRVRTEGPRRQAHRTLAQALPARRARASYPAGSGLKPLLRSRLIVFGLYKKECASLESDLNRKGGGALPYMET